MQVLEQLAEFAAAARYSNFLLYWYKRTNSDAEAVCRDSMFLLCWYKGTNSDAVAAF